MPDVDSDPASTSINPAPRRCCGSAALAHPVLHGQRTTPGSLDFVPPNKSTAVPIIRHGDANGRIVKCSRYCLLARESWRQAAQCFARPPGKSASRERSSGDGPRGPSGRRSPYYPLTNGGNERARPSDRRGSQAHFGPGAGCQVSFVEAFDLQRYAFHRFRPELISGSSDQSLPEHNWERLWDCGS